MITERDVIMDNIYKTIQLGYWLEDIEDNVNVWSGSISIELVNEAVLLET